MLCSELETTVAMITASLPALSSFFKRVLEKIGFYSTETDTHTFPSYVLRCSPTTTVAMIGPVGCHTDASGCVGQSKSTRDLSQSEEYIMDVESAELPNRELRKAAEVRVEYSGDV